MTDFSKYFIVGTNNNALHDTMNGMVVGELIRCKDCKYYRDDAGVCIGFGDGHYVMEEDFCSNAERREE